MPRPRLVPRGPPRSGPRTAAPAPAVPLYMAGRDPAAGGPGGAHRHGGAPGTKRLRGCISLATFVHRQPVPRVCCNGKSAAVCAARGEEAVTYQPPPDHGTDDEPTQRLPQLNWEYLPPNSDATASASGGYGAFRQPRAGRHRRPTRPPDGTEYAAGSAPAPPPASFPALPQTPLDPSQPEDPRRWPDYQPRQSSFAPYAPSSGPPPYPPQGQPLPSREPYPPYGQLPNGLHPYPTYDRQPSPAPRPPRRSQKSWPSRHKILATLAAVTGFFVIVVTVAAAATAVRQHFPL